jgi:hypothetical protein
LDTLRPGKTRSAASAANASAVIGGEGGVVLDSGAE